MAGGVFTPLSTTATNFELARALDPAIWVLVGSDTLGVLHDLTAATEAMRARGRSADFTVLSEARPSDASTGTNANELTLLGIASPVYTLARNDKHGIRALIHAILAGN
jgi:dethiobiotin synthetase